jgi:hypothetical protein
LNSIGLICILAWKKLIIFDEILIEVVLIDLDDFLFFFLFGFQYVDPLTHVIAALQCPAVGVFGSVVYGNTTAALFGDVIRLVFHVHVLFHEVAALVLEVLAVEGQDLGKQTSFYLLVELVD